MLREKHQKPQHEVSNVSHFQAPNASDSTSSQPNAFRSDPGERGTGASQFLPETVV